jgi:hypothetical protein
MDLNDSGKIQHAPVASLRRLWHRPDTLAATRKAGIDLLCVHCMHTSEAVKAGTLAAGTLANEKTNPSRCSRFSQIMQEIKKK